jgi:hypothetical protein
VGYDLSVVPQNWREDEDGVGLTSRSNGLLHLEASRVRVFQSALKTGGGTVRMVHVTLSWRSRGDEAEDGQIDSMGYIELFYTNFAIFIVLDFKDNLVF